MSLRLRLTAIYTGLLAIVLAVFGVAGYLAFDHTERAHIDDVLRTRAADIAANVDPLSGTVFLHGPSIEHPATYVQSVDTTGEVVDRNEALGVFELPISASVRAVAQGRHPAYFTTTEAAGVAMRELVAPVRVGTRTRGAVQLAVRLDDLEQTLERLRLVLLLGGLGGVVVAAGLGWAVARRALRPVDDIAAAAHEIGQTQDLSRRLAAHREDELGTLVESLNGMLDRLQHARDELEQTLEGQRRFLADVSHELRTPLTTVRGNLEVILRDRSLPVADRASAIADALEEAERMSRMVEDLLELARTGVAHDRPPEPVAFGRLVEDAVESARSRPGSVPIECSVDGSPIVSGNADQLRRLVDNLIDNAVKYTVDGSVDVTVRSDAGAVVCAVHDTGPGMTPSEAHHAFERFWRGDRARGEPGSGLGLAIAHAVAESHGGSISLDSRPGAGTTVTVRLPAVLMPLSGVPVRNEAEVKR